MKQSSAKSTLPLPAASEATAQGSVRLAGSSAGIECDGATQLCGMQNQPIAPDTSVHIMTSGDNDCHARARRVGSLLAEMVCRAMALQGAVEKSDAIPLPSTSTPSLAARIKAQLEVGAMSPKELAGMLNVSKATLGRALALLVKTGEICAVGSTKGRKYSLPAMLEWDERKSA